MNRLRKALFFVFALLAFGQTAWAQDITWTEVGTYSELDNAIIDGAHIRLTNDITMSGYLIIQGGQPGKTVVIDLNGHTLDRGLTAPTFNGDLFEVFGNLTLSNGTLTGGWNNRTGSYDSGCIYNEGTVTLNNVTINNCKAVDGGGIKNLEGGTLTITGGAITNCRSDAGGGGVVNYGTANISNCTFSGNIATTRGGAIWSNSALTVSGCTFNSNEALANGAGGDGGAIHLEASTATLTGVTITGNTSKDAGGIYVASSATLNLGGTSTLSGNTSTKHGGGGIVNQGTVNLSGTVSITGNTCATDGGGIWDNGTLTMQGNIRVYDNSRDDVFLKDGKVIAIAGNLTSGTDKIGISMETHGVLTSGWSSNSQNPSSHPFFSNQDNILSVVGGEYRLDIKYYNCSWNGTAVVRLQSTVPANGTVVSLCSSTPSTLSTDTWYIANGKKTFSDVVTCSGTVHIILEDRCELIFSKGIRVPSGSELHIHAQSNVIGIMGKIIATGESGAAGIGGKEDVIAGTITIHGGNIEATGGTDAAGIGGGDENDSGFNTINIYAGRVKAIGADYAAGIGFGDDNRNGGNINIYGCVYISAKGGKHGAGIGGGEDIASGFIHIYGGEEIRATGGEGCPGIGDGYNGYVGEHGAAYDPYDWVEHHEITIDGGHVVATGGDYGAGIGQANHNHTDYSTTDLMSITINDGIVTATGGNYGAGIGGNQHCSGAKVYVNGGNVHAYGGIDAAGIGCGEQKYDYGYSNGGTLTVTGGYVYAKGKSWGAGIGGGEDGLGADVTITGGTVVAIAGNDAANKRGCAIGSEDGGDNIGTLTIGDTMMVHAGQDASHLSSFTAAERVPACFYRPYARIEPCNHEGATYTVDGTTEGDHHTFHCSHCAYSFTDTHTFVNGTCSVCGASNTTVYHVDVFLPVAGANNSYTYSGTPSSTQQMVAGSVFELPAPPTGQLPTGVRFVGWRVGSPTQLGLTDPRITDNEQDILPAGSSYTINGNVSFTPRYKTFHVFTTTGNWDDATNWCWNTVPDIDKEIVIAAEATVPADYTAQLGNSVTIDLGGSITIADGGQLIHPQDVQATLEKQVTGYTANDNGWFTIASPVTGEYSAEGFVTDNYDLYLYHEPTHYWWNAKGDHGFNTLANGQGYLYANGTDKTLAFPGVMQGTGNTVTLPLSFTEDAGDLKGFNLLGNPFTRNLTSSDAIKIGGANLTTYYVVENGGALEVRNLNDTPIKPGQGFMVQATETGQDLVINQATRGEQAKTQPAYLCIEAGNETFMDRAYLQFGGGNTLRKMTLKDHSAQLSLQHEGKDWAAATIETAAGEMPVNFKATENGTYTISVSTQNLNPGYLHLFDNMTGADVDLLATPTYTFSAKTTDYESRFKLVFSANGSEDDENFAFFSNGELIVNGEGTLQVIDMLGHVIYTREVNSSLLIPHSSLTAGVYVLRLINGNDVKTQNIVFN